MFEETKDINYGWGLKIFGHIVHFFKLIVHILNSVLKLNGDISSHDTVTES